MCAGYPGHRRRQYGCLTKRPAQTRQPSVTTGSRPPILSMASRTPPTSSCACSASQGLAVDTAWSCGLHVCCRYLWRAGYISVNNPYWMAVILVCGLVWLGSLSFGRMYLGVHSPSDVEGGVVRPCFVSREPGGVSAGANLVLLSRLLAPASCLSHTCTAQKSTPGSLRMSMPFRCCSLGW